MPTRTRRRPTLRLVPPAADPDPAGLLAAEPEVAPSVPPALIGLDGPPPALAEVRPLIEPA